nr:PhnD/SsuA/transferrin family substrate-binding protein [uncultured Desulfobacter sp.]
MKRAHLIKLVPFRVLIMMLLSAAVFLQGEPVQSEEIVHIGFSRSIVGSINENDTMAAVKLWSTKLVGTDEFPVNVQPKIYEGGKEIEIALKKGMIDLINLSVVEFFDLQHLIDREPLIVAVYGDSITVEYLLLARKESRFADIKDLKGGFLKLSKNARTVLSTIWLNVKLADAGLPTAEQFFDKMVSANKISAALLPVFFGKADACLVTRRGFDTMAELNPQISHQLKIMAASKAYVPGFLGFRKNYQSRVKTIMLNNIENWDQTPAGGQILTIFQMNDITFQSFESLGPTMELIKEHRRLFGDDTRASRLESGAWQKSKE